MKNPFNILAVICVSLAASACITSRRPSADNTEQVAADATLAAMFEEAALAARDTPAYEATLHAASNPAHLDRLLRRRSATAEELARARSYIQHQLSIARMGLIWPAPPTIDVPRATQPLIIDGKLDDPPWRQAITFTGVYEFNTTNHVVEPATTWKILWDSDYLYFAFDCGDRDLVAQQRPRDDAVYNDDCVEMFIMPSMAPAVYWEVIINARGAIYDGLQAKKLDAFGPEARPQRDIEGLKVGIEVRGTFDGRQDLDSGYTVEVAVPFASLPEYSRCVPAQGQSLHLLLVRLDVTGDQMAPYAFIPLLSWGHNIRNYATIRLAGPPGL